MNHENTIVDYLIQVYTTYSNFLRITITHSRETYQRTGKMRWDRGIFNGSDVLTEYKTRHCWIGFPKTTSTSTWSFSLNKTSQIWPRLVIWNNSCAKHHLQNSCKKSIERSVKINTHQKEKSTKHDFQFVNLKDTPRFFSTLVPSASGLCEAQGQA